MHIQVVSMSVNSGWEGDGIDNAVQLRSDPDDFDD